MAEQWPMRILVVVKTYPTPSQHYGETVCCAGVDLETASWVRMYPIPFRLLEARFSKYHVIECQGGYPSGDQRPESRRIDPDSIEPTTFIPPRGNWRRRLELLPALAMSMEELVSANRDDGISIGAFRPKRVIRLIVETAEPWSAKQLRAIRQQRLRLGEDDSRKVRELEQLPLAFSYRFTCHDSRCRGHKMRILDWEIGEAYRKWSRLYPDDWEARLRDRFERKLPSKDLILIVGTMAAHPQSFVIIGLVYPPRPKVDRVAVQQSLDLFRKDRSVTRRRVLLVTKEANALAASQRQQSLDLVPGSDEPLAVPSDERRPITRQGTKDSRRTERGQ